MKSSCRALLLSLLSACGFQDAQLGALALDASAKSSGDVAAPDAAANDDTSATSDGVSDGGERTARDGGTPVTEELPGAGSGREDASVETSGDDDEGDAGSLCEREPNEPWHCF